MSKTPLLTVLMAASMLGAFSAMATPACADVIYTFDGDFQTSNSAPETASFSVTVPDYITSAMSFTPSNLSCSGGSITCTSVTFLPYAYKGEDVVKINYRTATSTGSESFDFAHDAFYTDGTDRQRTRTIAATLTTLCAPISAAPEPSTWLLMVAGIGGVGLMLRQTRRVMNLRAKGGLPA